MTWSTTNESTASKTIKNQQRRGDKMVLHEFSQRCKSKCTCCCCAQTSNCLSLETAMYVDDDQSDEYFTGTDTTNISTVNLLRRRARFILNNYLFGHRRRKPKCKLIVACIMTLVFMIYLISLINTHLYIMSQIRKSQSSDLMSDALGYQNITRFKIGCVYVNKTSEDATTTLDETAMRPSLSDKYLLLRDYYRLGLIDEDDDAYKQVNTVFYPLNYTKFFRNQVLSPHISTFLNALQLCAIRSFQSRFESIIVNFTGFDLFESLSQDKRIEELNQFWKLNLKPGGFYRAPLCIQDFFYFYSHRKGLEVIRAHMNRTAKAYARNSTVLSIRKLVAQIAKSTYRYVKEILDREMFNLNEYMQLKTSYTLIIIPYLNRQSNLLNLMANLHPFLQRQFLNYGILVAEQTNSKDPFNKGRIYNAAFDFVERHFNLYSNYLERDDTENKLHINCIILHDVDLVPESDYNMYGCDEWSSSPRHLSLSIRYDSSSSNKTNNREKQKDLVMSSGVTYKKNLYELLVGGVLCIKPYIFKLINGFSNEYWLWGGEDDDLGMRMIGKNVCINRPQHENALFRMLNHTKSEKNPVRENLLYSSVIRMNADGLSDLNYVNVSVLSMREYTILTHLRIFTYRPSSTYFQKY